MRALIFSAAAALMAATPATALQPLHENPTVRNGFYALGLADIVQDNCNSIEPRLITAWRYLKSLERYARDAGYTSAQIDDLIDNKSEKRKLRTEIKADLAARGASPGGATGRGGAAGAGALSGCRDPRGQGRAGGGGDGRRGCGRGRSAGGLRQDVG